MSKLPESLRTPLLLPQSDLDYCVLHDLGYPWTLRKAAVKYGSKATDIIKHKGSELRITTVNAKGSWSRVLSVGRETVQVSTEDLHCNSMYVCQVVS